VTALTQRICRRWELVGSSQDRNPSGRRFQGKKRSWRRRSLRHDTRREKKVRGFEADGCRKTCKKTIHGYGKGGIPEEKGWGKEGENGRVGGTDGRGQTQGVGRSPPGRRSKGCRQAEIRQRMHTVRNEKPHQDILSKADTGVGYLPRAIEAQMTVRIRTKVTPPGSHCCR